jgi:transcriptional regulator of acetoin/glycerol metabolism
LKLEATEEVTLYRLALPGLYRADRTMREQALVFEQSLAAWSDTSKGVAADASFGSLSQIQSAARDFAIAREQFLSQQRIANDAMRPRVARSWARSQLMGVDPGCSVASYSVVRDDDLREKSEINERLLRASKQITTYLTERLSDTGYAIVLTDAQGCLLRVSGDAPIQRRLSRLGFEPGGDWSERSAGTNAIGTAITDGRSLQLMGAEHYCDGWLGLTCTAAPIREASTSTIVGVLDVTADYRLIRPHLLGQITDCAMEIEEALSAIG